MSGVRQKLHELLQEKATEMHGGEGAKVRVKLKFLYTKTKQVGKRQKITWRGDHLGKIQ